MMILGKGVHVRFRFQEIPLRFGVGICWIFTCSSYFQCTICIPCFLKGWWQERVFTTKIEISGNTTSVWSGICWILLPWWGSTPYACRPCRKQPNKHNYLVKNNYSCRARYSSMKLHRATPVSTSGQSSALLTPRSPKLHKLSADSHSRLHKTKLQY